MRYAEGIRFRRGAGRARERSTNTMETTRAGRAERSVNRTWICCAAIGIGLWGVLSVGTAPGLSADPAPNVDPKAGAAELVHAALLAEASGNRESRRELLREAMKKDPNSALAHWSAGEVRRDERWLSLEEAQRQAAADPRLAEYRRLRDRQAGTPAGQLELARWCHDHGLPAESRVHYVQVLMLQPENPEARKALAGRWQRGQLLTEAQVKEAREGYRAMSRKDRQAMEREWLDRWATPVANWRRAIKQEEASVRESLRREVASAKGPLAIHVLGSVLFNGSRQRSDPKGYRLVSLALIDALDDCGKSWAVVQLARHAVEHPTAEVRDAATDALKERPKVSYVPWLLSRMQAPIEACIVVGPAPAGGMGVLIQQTFEREGPDAIYRDVRQQYYHAGTPRIAIQRKTGKYTTNIPQVVQNSWRHAENYAAEKQNQVERFNTAVAELNQQVQYVITRATGERTDGNPFSCQRWWTKYFCDYYELEQTTAGPSRGQYPYDYEQPRPEQKPVVEQIHTYGAPAPPVVVSVCSCFPRNTKVWTLTGSVDIDQIKPGDRVLAQQPSTGELSYRPVLQVTRRKPSPMIAIGLGNETIQATRGHPFWVSGEGWRMAKQLAVGMWLHTTDGPVRIDRVDEVPAARPWYEQPNAKPGEELSYNLVVDGCHNYFVGQQKLFVHDNTLFSLEDPVPAVPGLALAARPRGQIAARR